MRPRILKKEQTLSEFQKQVLAGYLLGDGHLETWINSDVARLKVEQSLRQISFVYWLFNIFQDFVKTGPKAKGTKIGFSTLSSKQLFTYKTIFYSENKKVIPKEIDSFLTPLSLAVWFMGDGSVKSKECNGRIINTQCFKELEIKSLCQILNRKFTLQTSIRRQKDGLQIYISAKSAGVLTRLIAPYLLPYFYYKLPKFKN